MKLNRETYEAWLLDRMEGRLSPAREKELDAFLHAHPDLQTGVDGLPDVEGGDAEFPLKNLLYRTYPPTGIPDRARLDDFLVARMEKELTSEQEKQLERYLYEHPEADRTAALMTLAKVHKEEVAFPEHDSIERHFPPKGLPDPHRLTDFLIADLEGDLLAQQVQALQRYLGEHPEAMREELLVAATRTAPIPLVFPEKERLKKRRIRVVPLWPRLVVAASILLLLSTGWWLLREGPPEHTGIAGTVQPAAPATVDVASAEKPAVPISVAKPLPKSKLAPTAPGRSMATMGVSGQVPRTMARRVQKDGHVQTLRPSMPTLQLEPVERPSLAVMDQAVHVPGMPATTLRPAAHVAALPNTGSDQDLGTFVANEVRGKVLDEPKRPEVLDRSDALAMADQAISTVTGGRGGLEVDRTSTRQRVKLRLGRNFSLSASRGR